MRRKSATIIINYYLRRYYIYIYFSFEDFPSTFTRVAKVSFSFKVFLSW